MPELSIQCAMFLFWQSTDYRKKRKYVTGYYKIDLADILFIVEANKRSFYNVS